MIRVISRQLGPLQSAINSSYQLSSSASFSSRRGGRKRGGRGSSGSGTDLAKTPPPPANIDPWEEVKDAQGNIYYWNTVTDETTAIGEPRPTTMSVVQQQSQGGGMVSGFAGMVAQGMAFGAGSSIAHHAIGGLFRGGGEDHGDDGGGSGDDGSWDI